MRKFLTIAVAGIITLFSLNSCEVMTGEFDSTSCDANLTCFYAGGLPSSSAHQYYELDARSATRTLKIFSMN